MQAAAISYTGSLEGVAFGWGMPRTARASPAGLGRAARGERARQGARVMPELAARRRGD